VVTVIQVSASGPGEHDFTFKLVLLVRHSRIPITSNDIVHFFEQFLAPDDHEFIDSSRDHSS